MLVICGNNNSPPNDVLQLSLTGTPTWSAVATSGTPPSGRFAFSTIYDAPRDRVILFGGYPNTNEVWQLTLPGTPTWSQITPSGTSPAARYGHVAVCDPVRDRMLIQGGAQAGTPTTILSDLWALSLSGSPAWTQISAPGDPAPQSYLASAIYDALRDRMLVISGLGLSGSNTDAVWGLSLEIQPYWTKIPTGGWVPLAFASLMFTMFITWRDGRQKLRAELEARAVSDKKLPELLAKTAQVPGTSVFLVSQSGFVPTALLRNIEHNKVHHEQIVILHIEIQRVPRVDPMARVLCEELYKGVFDVRARFGFMETPDVGEALRNARRYGLNVFAEDSSFFLGWHLVRARPRPGLAGLKTRAFAFLQRRSAQAAEFFRMPTRGVIVLATDIEI